MTELVKAKIDLLSTSPGVYLMKNEVGTIIYVGKAKSLIKRVKQYFYRPQAGKVFKMVMEVRDFDTIETTSEKEALLLEINLIRKYMPKYNILLKDGKSYPFIALKRNEDPYLKISYRDKDPRFKYFGPFPNSGAVYKTMDLLNKLFPLRKCKNLKKEPCLYYHMNQCLGPCINKITEEQYLPLIENINKILKGETSFVKQDLIKRMHEYSENLEFEKAQETKVLIDSLNYIGQQQSIMIKDHIDRDVIAISQREGYYALGIMTYRRGILLGKNIFVMEQFDDIEEDVISKIFQYYQTHDHPKEILISIDEIITRLNEILNIKVINPKRGEKKDLLIVTLENTKKGLDEHFLTARLDDDSLTLLEELGGLLGIPAPLRIELFDNSHFQGSEPIGAMVTFINGVKTPSLYRKYNITKSAGTDDLKSMYEVVSRRYSRVKKEGLTFPDLIIVDGGLNQVNVAYLALKEVGVDIPLVGLAKDDKHHTSGLVSGDGEIININRQSRLFLMLIRMQDEVHRYAITFNRQKRAKTLLRSFFDDIEGLGIRRVERLNKAYPSLDSLKKATKEELSQIVPQNVAQKIIDKLQNQQE